MNDRSPARAGVERATAHRWSAWLALAFAVACTQPPPASPSSARSPSNPASVQVQNGQPIVAAELRSVALPAVPFDPKAFDRSLPPDRAAELDALLQRCLDDSRGRAVVAAVHLPEAGTWCGARSRDPELRVDDGTRFHAASIGKAMTAALVLQLVEEGRFSLATTLDRWFPELPDGAQITVDHLLAHTSGLQAPELEQPEARHRYRSEPEVLAAVQRSPRLFPPGSRWSYCNPGYQLLGAIVAKERGMPCADVLRERLWQPLGMHGACWVTPDNQRDVLPDSRVGGRSAFAQIDYAVPLAAGAVAATPRDLVRFYAALLGGEVLRPETASLLTDRLLPMSPDGLWWGRGLMVLAMPEPIGEVVYNAGGIVGFQSALAWLPTKRAFVAVMVLDEMPAGPFLWRLANAL